MKRPEDTSADMSGEPARVAAQKGAGAYRTIGEVADELKLPQHVLRFWETRFPQVKPLKRAGGRRFYRPEDVSVLRAVQSLLYGEGYTIKGVQRLFGEFGARQVVEALARPGRVPAAGPGGLPDPHFGEGSATAMPNFVSADRRDPVPARPDATTPPVRPTGAGRATTPSGNHQNLVALLEGVSAELNECSRILRSLRSDRD